ncbi:MAG TPA: 2-phospho-L-lactate guanylyltransferase [Candidatus Binatia bacterium]|jgi:2-phospho-L-lactate guanylyltransferase|nr:2-phospho-L-lactate guanylyltransferase [Candidatus Binatia bacterium]
MKIAALIPVKGFANAKQRLSAQLSSAERALLAETMMRDVVAEAAAARGFDGVYVVTGNEYVAKIAAALGARVILEAGENGETGAVEFALAELKRRDVDAALVVPADMPLVRATDFEQVIGAAPSAAPFALLVPSHDRMGTNALLLAPPDIIRLRFGYDSFTYHISQVAGGGAPLTVIENERIALDIDEPQDLERFVAAGGGPGATYARLMEMRTAAPGTGA